MARCDCSARNNAALALIAGEGHLFGWVADLRDPLASTSQFA
jgi:hypothetical protein